jgi:hypothetical protein
MSGMLKEEACCTRSEMQASSLDTKKDLCKILPEVRKIEKDEEEGQP